MRTMLMTEELCERKSRLWYNPVEAAGSRVCNKEDTNKYFWQTVCTPHTQNEDSAEDNPIAVSAFLQHGFERRLVKCLAESQTSERPVNFPIADFL